MVGVSTFVTKQKRTAGRYRMVVLIGGIHMGLHCGTTLFGIGGTRRLISTTTGPVNDTQYVTVDVELAVQRNRGAIEPRLILSPFHHGGGEARTSALAHPVLYLRSISRCCGLQNEFLNTPQHGIGMCVRMATIQR